MSAPPDPAAPYWRRLSARMLLIHPITALRPLIPLLIGFLVLGRNSADAWWPLLGVVILAAAAVAKWLTTTYHLGADQVQLRTGVLHRKTVTARTAQVRSVDVTSSPIHRLLGLAQVRIGTGAGESHLDLDGLPAQEAAQLRTRLLHRAAESSPTDAPTEHPADPERTPISPASERVLGRGEPGWARYAPLRPAGLFAAWALIGLATEPLSRTGLLEGAVQRADAFNALAATVVVVGAILLIVTVSVLAYVLAFWQFTLSVDAGGRSLHVRRGLLTTRSTSLEVSRIRGIELREPVPLRWAGGAELAALATGVEQHEQAMSSLLLPASPRPVDQRVGEAVLDAPSVFALPIQRHGPRATRRRWTRALTGAALMSATVVVGAIWWHRPLLLLIVPVLLAAAAVLARDRADRLGHALTDRLLVIRRGGLAARTVVLERRGVLAVTVRSSYFQRRAGLVSVLVATAAGAQQYAVVDVPRERGEVLAAELLRSSSGTTFATASGCRE